MKNPEMMIPGEKPELKIETYEKKPTFEADEDGYVRFGNVSIELLNKQCQYGVTYAFGDPSCSCPNLGEGLRIEGHSGNYHDVKIHQDDIEEFVRRYEAYKKDPDSWTI